MKFDKTESMMPYLSSKTLLIFTLQLPFADFPFHNQQNELKIHVFIRQTKKKNEKNDKDDNANVILYKMKIRLRFYCL